MFVRQVRIGKPFLCRIQPYIVNRPNVFVAFTSGVSAALLASIPNGFVHQFGVHDQSFNQRIGHHMRSQIEIRSFSMPSSSDFRECFFVAYTSGLRPALLATIPNCVVHQFGVDLYSLNERIGRRMRFLIQFTRLFIAIGRVLGLLFRRLYLGRKSCTFGFHSQRFCSPIRRRFEVVESANRSKHEVPNQHYIVSMASSPSFDFL